jgi:hypothetical protein
VSDKGAWKAAKRALLSSGMPLEDAVASFLTGRAVTEYRYWRRNDQGLDEVFSIDLNTLYRGEGSGPTLDLFIECKYRSPTRRSGSLAATSIECLAT